MKTLILASSILLIAYTSKSQVVRVTNITGRANIVGDISPNDARKEALNDAKLNALKAAGIAEKISCYQSLNTDQKNDDCNQAFTSHIQSDILGAVKFDSITEEKIIQDSTGLVYIVKINAEVTTYEPNDATPTVAPTSSTVEANTPAPPPTDVNTNVVPAANHVADNYTGTRRVVYSNGDAYDGNWLNGLRSGYGVYTWANGDQYTGYYWNGKRSGLGTYCFANGRKFSGNWRDDVLINGMNRYQPNNGSNYYACNYYPGHTNYYPGSANYYPGNTNYNSGNTTNYYYGKIKYNGNNNATVGTANSGAPSTATPAQTISPEDKLTNDENNFSQEAEAEYQKLQQ